MIETMRAAMAAHELYREQERAWLSSASDIMFECEPGCNRCCRQLPLGTIVSGTLIASQLWGRDPVLLNRLIEQGARQSVLLADHHLEGSHLWLERNEPCALLRADGLCAVYEYRPPTCSSFFVQGGRATCESAGARTIVGSADNTTIQLKAYQLDAQFLEQVLGEDWAETMIVAPLGTMVKAGLLLLTDQEAFAKFVGGDQ